MNMRSLPEILLSTLIVSTFSPARPSAQETLPVCHEQQSDLSEIKRSAAVAKLNLRQYEGDYVLLSSALLGQNVCLENATVAVNGSLMKITSKVGGQSAELAAIDLGSLDKGPLNVPDQDSRDGRWFYVSRIYSVAGDDSVSLNQEIDGRLSEQTTFTKDRRYVRSIPGWGVCVYIKTTK